MHRASTDTLQMIGHIYDVGLSTGHWPDVIDHMVHHLGAKSSAIFYQDTQLPELNAEISVLSEFWRSDEIARYRRTAGDEEPSARLMRSAQPGDIVTSESIPWTEKLRIAPYAAKLWHLFGIRAVAAARLNDEAHWFDYITFQFDTRHGPMRPDEMAGLKVLLPHAARAMEISRPIALLERRYRAVLEVLDHLHIGVMVISQRCAVVVANKAAQRVLEAKDGLSLDTRGSLAAENQVTNQGLQQCLRDVIDTSKAAGTSNGSVTLVRRRSGRDPYLLQIVPLSDHRGHVERGFHGALAFCIDPDETRHVSTNGMQRVYGLTDAESAVCRLVIDGLSYAEMADARGVSPETIKSQVQAALKKTRSENRTMLVRLALSLNIPVDGPADE